MAGIKETSRKIFKKSLASRHLRSKVVLPNENWALRRVLAMLNVCHRCPAVFCSPARNLLFHHNSRRPCRNLEGTIRRHGIWIFRGSYNQLAWMG